MLIKQIHVHVFLESRDPGVDIALCSRRLWNAESDNKNCKKKIYKIYKIKIDFQKSNRFSKIDYPKSFLLIFYFY